MQRIYFLILCLFCCATISAQNIEQGDYTIFHADGKLVLAGTLSVGYILDMSEFSAGVYFMSVQVGKEWTVRRFVKM